MDQIIILIKLKYKHNQFNKFRFLQIYLNLILILYLKFNNKIYNKIYINNHLFKHNNNIINFLNKIY